MEPFRSVTAQWEPSEWLQQEHHDWIPPPRFHAQATAIVCQDICNSDLSRLSPQVPSNPLSWGTEGPV